MWKCVYEAEFIPYEFTIELKLPPLFRTAGFGVFAGRALKQGELMATWKTLFLPENFPKCHVRNYVFGHNHTHMAFVLDYGSVLNHHESANVKAVVDIHRPASDNVHFQVRRGFVCANHNALKITCMHAHKHNKNIQNK